MAADPSEPNGPGLKSKLRIESLSDLVFGLALSLGAFVLISKPTATPDDLIQGIALFAFSFVIVIAIWSGYTRTMAYLVVETPGTYLLNILLLFFVAIEPYLLYVMFTGPLDLLNFASSVYALNYGAMLLIEAGLVYLLLGQHRERKIPPLQPRPVARFKRVMQAETASGFLFVLSALPYAWIEVPGGVPSSFLRFDIWYATFAVFFVLVNLGRRHI
ncbi:MAG: DUF1211 domain-containing protein [Thermoplasmata archaeon]|nr:DUF1211 domain-containing protein [Thermoplasmata archaeon]